MEELFKEVAGFPDYEISNFGRVRTKARKIRYTHHLTGDEHFRQSEERFMEVYENKYSGYKFVVLRYHKKQHTKTIHRLVMLTFKPVPGCSKLVVNHIDGNKHNNTLDNLEWVSNEYNHYHATINGLKPRGDSIGSSKLNDSMVHAIKWFLNKGVSHAELGRAFLVSRPTISGIAANVTWKHVALTGSELTITEKATT